MAVVVVAASAWAGVSSADNRAPEDRAVALAGQLKCLQCVGESVAASQAPLAVQFREQIHRQVTSGATDQEVLDYFVRRYGDQVLLTPPSSGAGSLIWVLPVVVLAAVAVGLGLTISRRRAVPAAASGGVEPVDEAVAPAGAASAPRWRAVVVAGGVLAFAVLAGVLVARGSGSRSSSASGGMGTAATDRSQQLARCQPVAMKDPAKGVACYDALLERSPDDVEALAYRGWAHLRGGDTTQGVADLDRAIVLDPSFADAHAFRASAMADAGDFAGAAAQISAFYAAEPSQTAVSVMQSQGLERKVFFGLMSEPTRHCWESAASSNGEGTAVNQAFLDALGTCADQVLATDPASRDALLSRAMADVGPDRKDLPAARSLLERMLATDPHDADALSLMVALDIGAADLSGAESTLGTLASLPRAPGAFLLGDVPTLRQVLSTARAQEVPNSKGG